MKFFYRPMRYSIMAASLSCLNCASHAWPSSRPATSAATPSRETGDDALVRSLPLCIATESWSAGDLGPTVLYRYERDGRRLSVGYFVYWSTERPWGWNALSYSVIPAFFIDAFYSHLFFVLPGAQRIMYGPGDVEGARIVYEQTASGRWVVVSAVASNAAHREVSLSPRDIVNEEGTVVLTTEVWSHQLGGRSGDGNEQDPHRRTSCFVGASLAPLTHQIVQAFRLGSPDAPRRAAPAWNLGAPAATESWSEVAAARRRARERPRNIAAIAP